MRRADRFRFFFSSQAEADACFQERQRRTRRVDVAEHHLEVMPETFQRADGNATIMLNRIHVNGPHCGYAQFRLTDAAIVELVDILTKYLELEPPAQRLEFVMAAPPAAAATKRKRPRLELVPTGAPPNLTGDELAIYRQMTEGKGK